MCKMKNRLTASFLAVLLIMSVTVCGCEEGKSGFTSFNEWLVHMSTGTGRRIEAHARVLSHAVKQLFYKYEVENNVRYYEYDPLVGEFVEDEWLTLEMSFPGGVGIKSTINLRGARVTRRDIHSRWEIDIDSLPPDIKNEYLEYQQ